ncbi:MAG TPA: FMN-binding glutamate synthase family protein [Gammaproteobacteria bacterium]|nr:FMN-binding glutamate synthase family protein [Gammaproteobacteria bacterium]
MMDGILYFAIIFSLFIIALFFYNIFQRRNPILRIYPVLGYARTIALPLGVFLRKYFYARDREELPFNRVQRTWINNAADGIDEDVGFGSTRDCTRMGSIFFVDAPFPVIKTEIVKARPITIGPHSRSPYTTDSLVNISAMSYGALSKNAVLALSHGAKKAGCWMNTGEGGLTDYHLSGGCDIIAQIGTAKYGYRDDNGNLCEKRLKAAAAHPQVKMFEVKLSQGAKPGVGGMLPAPKVTEEVANIRGIPAYQDSISPNRFPEISNCSELLDFIHKVREITGKPTGFKTVLGSYTWLDELCREIIKRGSEFAPDFITLDGSEGGTGAAPLTLIDYMGLPITESLPRLVDILVEYNLRDRIKVIASGKLVNPRDVAWALCIGADFINTARGFLFSLGCIQAMQCHSNRCPTGITSHHGWRMRGLVPEMKYDRVHMYVKNLNHEIGLICHSCGVQEPRELNRNHIRIVTEHGTSVSFAELHPNKVPGSKLQA